VSVLATAPDGVTVALGDQRVTLEPGFRSAHLLSDLWPRWPRRARSASSPAARWMWRLRARGERLSLAGRGCSCQRLLQRQPDVEMRAALTAALTAPGRGSP